MPYRLGLDLGTNSIGWSALTLDADGRPCGVKGLGARIFGDGRNPKDGTSLAMQRRGPRSMRRRRDRYLRRRSELTEELIALGLMPSDATERKSLEALDPYELRAKALHGSLKPYELGRALFHLNQRRGFKSNRKTDKAEDNKLTERMSALKQRIKESKSETLGEYLYKRRCKGRMVRARPEAGFYPDRALYESEFDAIRRSQAPHQSLREDQWDSLKDTIFYQRDLKPVDPGWCLLEEGERRAHRALPLTQEFRIVQETNNLRILRPGAPAAPPSREQRDRVLNYLRTHSKLDLEKLVNLLALPDGACVNLLDENRKALKGDETAARLSKKELFGKAWHTMPLARRMEIARKLIDEDSPDEVARVAQAEWELSAEAAAKLAATPLPEGYARLSEKAIAKILPIMEEQGLVYSAAVAEHPDYAHYSDFRPDTALDALPYYGAILTRQVVGGDPTKPKDDAVAHYGRIANPTVHIGLGQLRQVVNGLIAAYGKPQEIVVELARELKMNKEEKNAERQKNRDNEQANTRRAEQICAAGGVPSRHLLRKLRLWEEQKYGVEHVCPFTGASISFAMAVSEATEMEHILPFSKTLDDSMANKVLALREANRAKADHSPYDAFHSNPTIGGRRYVYDEVLLRADKLPPNKRWRFYPDAMERFEDEKDFLDRQLNETKYLSRIARLYLAHLYNEKAEGRLRVRAIPGKLTAMLRGKWGLNALLKGHNVIGDEREEAAGKKRRDDHRHHALDAFVVALTDQALLKRISELNSDTARKRLIEAVPPPWEGFNRDDLRAPLERLVVSHKPDHGTFGQNGKTSGALHKDTAYGLIGPVGNGKWKVVSRVALASITERAELDAVRDPGLRAALQALWDKVEKEGGKPADFTVRAAKEGVTLGGRTMKVRRVRMIDSLGVVPIRDRKTGKPYKAYKPDSNAFADIYELPSGRWTAAMIRRFDANQKNFDPSAFRPHPAARRIMRLHIDDMVAVNDGGRRRILRVVKLSGQKITLADHNEGGALKARDADKGDAFKYLERAPSVLKEMGLRKVGVDVIGRLTDPELHTRRNTP